MLRKKTAQRQMYLCNIKQEFIDINNKNKCRRRGLLRTINARVAGSSPAIPQGM